MTKEDSIYNSFNILKNVLNDGAYLNIELNHTKDKGAIKYSKGVMEHYFELTYIVDFWADKKIKKNVYPLFLIGAYMIKYLDYSASQVCNYIKPVLEKLGKKAIYNFCVFIFQKIETENTPLPKENSYQYLEIKYNYPSWIIGLIKKDYENEYLDIISTKKYEYKHIRISNKEDKKQILNNISVIRETSTGAYVINDDKVKELINSGKATYMSFTSSLLCTLVNINNAKNLLDTCASPGGKSIYFAEKGILVTSCDIHQNRVELIKSYANRMKVNLDIQLCDATKNNNEFNEKFDIVLCDVPCSGLGVINEKLDIILNRKFEDLLELSKLQLEILNNCCKYVKAGGYLYYSTCTITKMENENNIREFLSNHPNFIKEKIGTKTISDILEKENDGSIQFLPNNDGMEGFYICQMKRIK
ncbi:MAG: methyltransferase domain-containing protein [Clostridia bacterium]|nr:methyltransferase domain-containing protein [Clostridia bacterium]